jgi:multicomponent K+:H+ antiporter subunit G
MTAQFSELLIAFLIVLGGAFALIGSWGLARLPSLMTRLHGPTKATTLGVGSLLFASLIFMAVSGDGLRLHKVLIAVFLFLTAPVSAHLIAKAALRLKVDPGPAGEAPERREGQA